MVRDSITQQAEQTRLAWHFEIPCEEQSTGRAVLSTPASPPRHLCLNTMSGKVLIRSSSSTWIVICHLEKLRFRRSLGDWEAALSRNLQMQEKISNDKLCLFSISAG